MASPSEKAPQMEFQLPAMYDHPHGWGPPQQEDNLPFDIPYQPFMKGERLGKVCQDWMPVDTFRGRGRFPMRAPVAPPPEAEDGEKEEAWKSVEYYKPPTRKRFIRGRGKGQMGRGQLQNRRPQPGGGGGRGSAPPKSKKRDLRDPGFRRKDVHRTASIEVKQSWKQCAQIALVDLKRHADIPKDSKTGLPIPSVKTLAQNGTAKQYNPDFEKVKGPLRVVDMKSQKEFSSMTASPTVREMMGQCVKEEGIKVFATEEILATLMCARQSVNSWDIQVDRVGDVFFMESRPGTVVDMCTVNETSNDPPQQEEPPHAKEEEKINTQPALMKELTQITTNLSQMLLHPKAVDGKRAVKEAVPSEALEECGKKPASAIYRYRQWKLEPGDEQPPINVFARCHVDGYVDRNSSQTYRAFAVFDPSARAWKTMLPGNEGAATASELKNNSSRMGKQACMALLSGADYIRLGFVTRKRPEVNTEHEVVHLSKREDPRNICTILSLSYRGMWNVLHKILEELLRSKDGSNHQRFIILKEPNKAQLTIYDVGSGAEEEDDDDDSDEEDEEDEEEESEES